MSCFIGHAVLYLSETAELLDTEEMESYDMTLTEKEFNPILSAYTTSSYIVHCPDISPFFHDTWTNVAEEAFPVVNVKSETSMFGAMGSLARNMRNSFRTSGPFGHSTDTLEDFEDSFAYITPKTPKRRSFFEEERWDSL